MARVNAIGTAYAQEDVDEVVSQFEQGAVQCRYVGADE